MTEEIHELLDKYFQSNRMGERQETILEISRRLKLLDEICELGLSESFVLSDLRNKMRKLEG